jgi:hypothetical protein
MKRKTIKKDILVQATPERVWQVLLEDQYTRQWYEDFSPGSHAQTDWKEGSKALFIDASGNGLVARITKNKPFEELAMEHLGAYFNGREDYESSDALSVKGGQEIYRLTKEGASTRLTITCDMAEEVFEGMSAAWESALIKLKQLAEKKPNTQL